VELLRRRLRQMASDDFCAATEEVLGRKVLAMLGDHNAVANSSMMVILLGPERRPSVRRRRGGRAGVAPLALKVGPLCKCGPRTARAAPEDGPHRIS
jgi:hypothetical protein